MNSLSELLHSSLFPSFGEEMYALIKKLYPICRSITGSGVEETLSLLAASLDIQVRRVPSGTAVFDWTVPKEWNIRDAFVRDPTGRKIIDFNHSNVHVVSYSQPVDKGVSLDELMQHVITLPEHPDWIPYRTSYYTDAWGFCAAHNAVRNLPEGTYDVVIDSSLSDGDLVYGEYCKPGVRDDEVLISTHICHPSLCNDNLSGIALTAMLAKLLTNLPTEYTYRFLFIPGTIGSITWLSQNRARAHKIKHGLVATCVGDDGPFRYKHSRQGNAVIDRAVLHVLKHWAPGFLESDFSPYGYDERQYCSPGFNLKVGSLTRSSHGQYPQYHTSADDLAFVAPINLAQSLEVYARVLYCLEAYRTYVNLNPYCEPQLGRRGLYDAVGGHHSPDSFRMALLWVLNQSDGDHSVLDIAERSGIPFDVVAHAASALVGAQLLAPKRPPTSG
jgi:aminopeptidase-like protein